MMLQNDVAALAMQAGGIISPKNPLIVTIDLTAPCGFII